MRSLLPAVLLLAACRNSGREERPKQQVARGNNYIVVAEEHVKVPFPVVTFEQKGAFDAHLEHCFFAEDRKLPKKPAIGCNTPKRYGFRSAAGLEIKTQERQSRSDWNLALLKKRIDLIVLHYDAASTSRRAFEVLHDERGLSVHFLIDVDGTIYQTLDLSLRARHAGFANDRSIGIEVAHIGAYPDRKILDRFYLEGKDGRVWLAPPAELGPPRGGPFETASDGMITGKIHGHELIQPDYTVAQYRSMRLLVHSLLRTFPKIRPDVPRNPDGSVLDTAMPPDLLRGFSGVLGHYHLTENKVDPGPALNWDRVVR